MQEQPEVPETPTIRRARKRRRETNGLAEPETPARRVRRRCPNADDNVVTQLEQISNNIIDCIDRNQAAMLQQMAEQTRSFERMFMAVLNSGRNANNPDNSNS